MSYPKTVLPPWDHQVESWRQLKNNIENKRFGIYLDHDMGTGKTKSALDFVTGFKSKRTLISCPAKAVRTWLDHYEGCALENSELIVPKYDLPKSKGNNTKYCAEYIMDRLKSSQQMKTHPIVIINHEKTWRPPMGPKTKKSPWKIQIKGVLLSWLWHLYVVDEAHRLKAHNSKVSYMGFHLARKARLKILLSGTPFPQGPMDAFGQWRILDPGVFGMSFVKFRSQYAILNPFLDVPSISEYQNLDDMFAKIKPWIHTVKAEDVQELPKQIDYYPEMEIGSKAMKYFRDIRDKMITVIEADIKKGLPVEIIAKNHASKFIKLQQATAGIATWTEGEGEDEKKFEEIIDTSKADWIVDKISDLSPTDEPVVVFCKFTPERKVLHEKLSKIKDRTISQIAGGIDELQEFKDGKTNLALVQIDAGGEAIDLSRARYVFYASTGVKTGTYRQSRKRVHRPGQERKCFYYHVVAKGTWDNRTLRSMFEKGEVSDFVLGGIVDYIKTGKAPDTKFINDLELDRILRSGREKK